MTTAKTGLFIDLSNVTETVPDEADLSHASGFVVSEPALPEGLLPGDGILTFLDVSPRETSELLPDGAPAIHVCPHGLEETARQREKYPEVTWFPRTDVHRLKTGYYFPASHYDEGFRTYRPIIPEGGDYRCADGDTPLTEWLKRAKEMGFTQVWLHAPEAERAGRGLDLDMLELARAAWPGGLWLSGGATTPEHLGNLVREGGAEGVVVPLAMALAHGCDALVAALRVAPSAGERGPATLVTTSRGKPSRDNPQAG